MSIILKPSKMKYRDPESGDYIGINAVSDQSATPIIEQWLENHPDAVTGSPLTATTVKKMTNKAKIYVYVGSENGYTYGNWYYWNGSKWTSGGIYNSLATNTDLILVDTDLDQASPLTKAIFNTSTVEVDLAEQEELNFLSDIMAGESITGKTYFPKSLFTHGDPANLLRTHRIYNPQIINNSRKLMLSANDGFRFYIYFYDSNDQQIGASGWQTNYTLSEGRFRIVIARVTESISEVANIEEFLSEISFEGLVSYINLKNKANLNGTVYADWKVGGYNTMASVNGTTSASPRRRRTELFFDTPRNVAILAPLKTQFVAGFYDLNDVCITYRNTFTSEPVYACNVSRLRIAFKDAEDTAENPIILNSEAEYNSGLTIIDLGLTTLTTIQHFKVMSYNIGRFSYGISPYYLSENYDEKVVNYKKFFAEENADLIGIQEFNTTLDINDGSGEKNTDTIIFDYLYPYRINRNASVSLKSKIPMFNSTIKQFTTGRYYAEADIVVNGKNVHIMNVHFSPNSSGETDRQTEANELLIEMNKYERVICTGDFNSLNINLFQIFINAGYKECNGGYLPREWTYSYDGNDFINNVESSENVRYIDNIIVSSNIIINNSYRKNIYEKLSSDHIPFIADLLI